MEIVLIRHAQPEWSRDDLSVADPGLTERGMRQALAAADRLATEPPFDELIVSPARRARATADPVARRLGLTPIVVDDFQEIRGPVVDGMPSADVERLFHEAHDRPPQEWWGGFSGVEAFGDFHRRVVGALESVLSKHGIAPRDDHALWDHEEGKSRIVVVAHGGTNAVIIGRLLGLEPTPWEWERFVSNHASVSRLMLRPLAGAHVFGLLSSNGVEHLVPADRTR